MSTTDHQPAPTDGRWIGSLAIDPDAESPSKAPVVITGQDEVNFYKQAGAQERLRHNAQNLGLLGKIFGANSEAPTNIAGLVVVALLVLVGSSLFMPGNSEIAEVRKLLIGLIGLVLGYLFGAASKR